MRHPAIGSPVTLSETASAAFLFIHNDFISTATTTPRTAIPQTPKAFMFFYLLNVRATKPQYNRHNRRVNHQPPDSNRKNSVSPVGLRRRSCRRLSDRLRGSSRQTFHDG